MKRWSQWTESGYRTAKDSYGDFSRDRTGTSGTSNQIIEAIISVLERTPPELSADILERGIMLTGGGAKLRGLEEMIEERTGINTMTAEEPTQVVAIGTGEYVELMSARGNCKECRGILELSGRFGQ